MRANSGPLIPHGARSMLESSRTVALRGRLGRPNVGKSRLFNRLTGRRLSIVHDQPGVTRDVISAEVGDAYCLPVKLDTGGIGMDLEQTPQRIAHAAEDQVEFALQAAQVILFVVDAQSGITTLDERVAEKLRRYGPQVLLVANKVDMDVDASQADEFVQLGLGMPVSVSAEHGRGVIELNHAIEARLGPKPPAARSADRRIPIALFGRPNVGKSSLGNALLKSQRLIVSDVPGTTRDAVELDLEYQKSSNETLKFRLADTAGLRSKRKVDSSVEYFSSMRTQHALERSDVVFLVIDAMEGVTKQDQALAGAIQDAGKSMVVVVNKWDLVLQQWEQQPVDGFKNVQQFAQAYEKSLRKQFFFFRIQRFYLCLPQRDFK